MSDDSDSFSVNGDDPTGPLSDSGSPAEPTMPDPRARSRRVDFRGKIGNFLIHREIGRGGMGVVYEAVEEILNRRVALKVLPSGALIDEMQIRRFRNEATAAAQLVHPNIVPVYSTGTDRGVHYYAMQLIDGQNIAEIIGSIRERISSDDKVKQNTDTPRDIGTTQRTPDVAVPKGSKDASSRKQLMEDDFAAAVSHHRHPQSCQRLFKSIAAIGCDAARAIHYAHDAGIVHRDIKPHNLMLDEKGKVWITDFGLAQVRDNPVGTRTGDILGTLKYMSPEQASGRKFLIDHRTDIYSLGVTLYELLTLKPAYSGVGAKEIIRQISFEDPQSLRLVNPRIPAELETIISKSIAKNPQERYETAAAFADDLDRFCNDQPIAARRPSVLQKARRWVIKNPTRAGMIGVAMVFTFISSLGVTAATWRSNHNISLEREKAVSILTKSEGLRLLTHSRLELAQNPGVALALAMEGAKRVSGLEANLAVQDAFNACHEKHNFQPRPITTAKIEVANRSQSAVLTVGSEFVGKGNYPALVIDLKTTKTRFQLDSGEAITSAVYSPNEEFLLTVSSSVVTEESVRRETEAFAPILWDAANGRRLTPFPKHEISEVRADMFSADSANVVIPGPDNEACIYSTQTFGLHAVLRGHKHRVLRAAYSPNGQWIATIDGSGEARIWSAADGQFVRTIGTQSDGAIRQFQFSIDSNRLIVASQTGTRTYAVNDDTAKVAFWREPQFTLSPQLNRCACYWESGKGVEIRDVVDGHRILGIETSDDVESVAFSANGLYLLVACGSNVSMHDAATGLKLCDLLGHTDTVLCARFNKTEGTIVTSAKDRSVRIWHPKSGEQQHTFSSSSDGRGMANVQFSADSRYMLSNSSMDFQTVMFDANGNRIRGTHQGELLSDRLLGGCLLIRGSTVSVVDPSTSRTISARDFAGVAVHDVIPIADGKTAIVRFNEFSSMLWNTTTNEVTPLTEIGDQIVCYDVLPGGTKFLVGTANGRCQLHDSASGTILRTIFHSSLVSSVRYLTTGPRIITVDERNTIRIWGDDDLTPERTITKDNYSFTTCLISTDSKSVVTFHESKPQPICCWNVDTGELRFETPGTKNTKLVVHPSNGLAYCGSTSKGLFAWNLDTGERLDISSIPVLSIACLAEHVYTVEMPRDTNFQHAEFMFTPNEAASSIGVYSTSTNKKLKEIPAVEGFHRKRISVDEAKQEFAVSTMVHSVKLVDQTMADTAGWIGAHFAPISFAGFFGDSNQVVTASWDGSVKIWSEGKLLIRTLVQTGDPITAGALSSNGQFLALGSKSGTINVWDMSRLEHRVGFEASSVHIKHLEFDAKAQHLLLTDQGGKVRQWNMYSRKFIEIKAPSENCIAMFSKDSHFAILFNKNSSLNSRSESNGNKTQTNVVVHNLESGTSHEIPSTAGVTSGAISNKADRIALVLEDGNIALFNLSLAGTAELHKKINTTKEKFTNCSFSPNGELLATATDHTVSLWDTTTGNEQHRVKLDSDSFFDTGDPSRGEIWNPFSLDSRWIGLSSIDNILVRPVSPPKVFADMGVRPLTLLEKEQYHVGLDDIVNVHSD